MRFIRQIKREERQIGDHLGKEYSHYCKKTPRIFPGISQYKNFKTKEVLNLQEAFSTNEQGNLYGWVLLAIIIKFFQETIVYGYESIDFTRTMLTLAVAVVVFIAGYGLGYKFK